MVQWIPGQGLFLFAMKVQRPGAERAETERKDDIFNQRFNDISAEIRYDIDT